MNSHPLFAAAVLAIGLSVTDANAGILVSGTNKVGVVGQTVYPTYTIDTFTEAASSPVIDVTQIGVWDFELNWDAAALEFKPDASRITVNEIDRSLTEFLAYLEALDPDDSVWNPVWNPILTSGFYRFAWADLSFDPDKQLNIGSSTSSILFTAAFEIESEAVPGTSYDITFGTGLTRSMFVDINEVKASYPSELTPMRVTVQPIPEPGMLGLLLGGMVAYLGAVRLRRSGRG
jgi:hypothetical protein